MANKTGQPTLTATESERVQALVIELRDKLGSQSQLARAIGVTQAAVSAWILRKSRPDLQTIKSLARLAGRPYTEFIDSEQHQRSRADAREHAMELLIAEGEGTREEISAAARQVPQPTSAVGTLWWVDRMRLVLRDVRRNSPALPSAVPHQLPPAPDVRGLLIGIAKRRGVPPETLKRVLSMPVPDGLIPDAQVEHWCRALGLDLDSVRIRSRRVVSENERKSRKNPR